MSLIEYIADAEYDTMKTRTPATGVLVIHVPNIYSPIFSYAQMSSDLPTLASGIARTSDSRFLCTEDKD